MKKIKYSFFIVMLLGVSIASAKLRVTKVDFLKESVKNPAKLVIHFSGKLEEVPEVSTRSKMVQIAISNAVVWPKIEKKITLGDLPFDATLMAYQFDRNFVRVRVNLPYSITGNERAAKYNVFDQKIILQLPRKKSVVSGRSQKKEVLRYDESYLSKLLRDKSDREVQQDKKLLIQKSDSQTKKSDFIKTGMAAVGNIKDSVVSKFSIGKYVGKFIGFLGLILLLFYGVVTLLKKGVARKGKLGFLNNMKPINVLSTTYLGPKKQLVLVKVHDQILLLGSSDKGISFLTEVNDTNSFLKEGEKSVTGENFETNLQTAGVAEKEQKIKKETDVSSKGGTLEKFLKSSDPKDKVKLSDRIKNRVKDLKPLQ